MACPFPQHLILGAPLSQLLPDATLCSLPSTKQEETAENLPLVLILVCVLAIAAEVCLTVHVLMTISLPLPVVMSLLKLLALLLLVLQVLLSPLCVLLQMCWQLPLTHKFQLFEAIQQCCQRTVEVASTPPHLLSTDVHPSVCFHL